MNTEIEILSLFMQVNVDYIFEAPHNKKLQPLPEKFRPPLVNLIVETQKRLIQLMQEKNYSQEEIGIEKGALKVLENYLQNIAGEEVILNRNK